VIRNFSLLTKANVLGNGVENVNFDGNDGYQ